MKIEDRAVRIYTRETEAGITTGAGIAVEIDGIEIPLIESVQIHEINGNDVVAATITLHVRLGKQ